MALLTEEFENTTTVIGAETNGKLGWIGTGFFVAKQSKQSGGSFIFLVTNKHVIQKKDKIKIRQYLKTGKINTFDVLLVDDTGKKLYTEHPDNKVDIAVVQLSGQFIQNNIDKIKAFDFENAAMTSEQYLDEGGFDGSSVFMLGFPMGIIDAYSTTPICRRGCIARFKQNDIKNTKNFILDIQNFPGNSGSPIITCPDVLSIGSTKSINKAVLIGIVHSMLPCKELLMNMQTNEVVELRSENSGLAFAHPVEFIKETIELDLKSKNIE